MSNNLHWTEKDLENINRKGNVDTVPFAKSSKIGTSSVATKERKSKYNVADAKDRMFNGKLYDSKLEREYRAHLELLKCADLLKNRVMTIQEQVQYPIFIKGIKIFAYILDFLVIYGDNRIERVDTKGVKTAMYKLKKKAVEAEYEFEIKEVVKGQF